MSARTWTGRIVLALPILFLTVDAVVKLLRTGPSWIRSTSSAIR